METEIITNVDDLLLSRKKELENKIKTHLESGKPVMHVIGAFGDVGGCIGIIEGDPIFPPEGGAFMKLYGCPYLLTGFPDRAMVEWFGLPKAMVSAIPREIVAKSWTILLALGFLFIFRPKKFVHLVKVYFSTIYANFIKKVPIADYRYNKVSRELRRAVRAVLERHNPSDLLHQEFNVIAPKRELGELVANITEFACYLIELDSAYRFPFQDVFGQIDKKDFERSVPKALNKALGVMADRWQIEGLKTKARLTARLVIPLLYLSPTLRRWVRDIVLELDLSKIRMDEHDWYFCLEREAYNYMGLSFEQRMICRRDMDEKAGVIRLNITPRADGGIDIRI